MSVRIWNGGTGDWAAPGQWHDQETGSSGAPIPGDTAELPTGDATVIGAEGLDGSIYDGVALILGDAAGDPATLDLQNAFLGHYFSINAAGSATLAATGITGVACPIMDTVNGSTLTLRGNSGSDLIVERGGSVSAASGTTLEVDGQVTAEANMTAAAGSTFVNNGDLTTLGSLVDVEGALTGSGVLDVDDSSTLRLGGTVASGQTVNFGDLDGLLQLGDPAAFSGAVTDFQASDRIEFAGVTATAASYDAGSQTLTLTNDGTTVATLNNVQAAAGSLSVVQDTVFGGASVFYTGSLARERYQIADADRAMRSDVVRDTMTVPNSQTFLTGAGEKIGIISNSFNLYGTANQDAAAGYLPANPDGTSAVQVLKEGPSGGDDEGREMAELIHQVAPGAQLFFASGTNNADSYADSIQQLQQAGCTIIADDENGASTPFYQVAGEVDAAALAAIGKGVNYFDSAGNFGQSFLEESFRPQTTTLPNGATAQAQVFDNGSSGEPITIPANMASRIDLQWTAPYEGGGQGAPQALALQVFDANGGLVTSATGQTAGTPVIRDGLQTTDLGFALPTNPDRTTYRLSVSLNGNQVSPDKFKLILSNNGGTGTGSGGLIDDAQAGQGSGDERGLQLIPAVNSVGAAFYGNSAAFGGTPRFNEQFTDVGPGSLYYDQAGNALPSPQSAGKLDFDAPDGVPVPDPQSANPNQFVDFYGTSAAAPNAAGVAALMLQANPNLSTSQVSSLLADSAIDQGLTPAQQGTGLIQADRAVQMAMATGTDANDNLAGSAGNDTITGLSGDDTISGQSGDDVILGNQGNDIIAGNQGNDLLFGGQGQDTIFGGQGDDVVAGNQGDDVILGNQGNDVLIGGFGNDSQSGGQGNDVLLGNQGNDILLGNEGNDVLLGNQGNDVLFGGQGDDTLYGGQGNDTLIGGEGNDLLYGNEGSNLFLFNPGDTNFNSDIGTGDEIADFKSGTDQIRFTGGPAGTTANLGTTTAPQGGFASVQAAAQQLLNGGDIYAFVSDGHDGFLFTSAGNPDHTIHDAVELAGVTSLQPGDIC